MFGKSIDSDKIHTNEFRQIYSKEDISAKFFLVVMEMNFSQTVFIFY